MRKKQWLGLFIVIIIITVPSHIIMNKVVFNYDFKTISELIIKRLVIGTVTSIGLYELLKINAKKFKT